MLQGRFIHQPGLADSDGGYFVCPRGTSPETFKWATFEFPCYCDFARNSLSGTIGVCSRIILGLPFCLAFHYKSTRKIILVGCCRLVPFPPEVTDFLL
jgi:hypothetical protein